MTLIVVAWTIVIGVAASFLAMLLFEGKIGAIRARLAKARGGWLRRRYVNVFVGAVRGDAKTSVSMSLNVLQLTLMLGAIALLMLWMYVLSAISTVVSTVHLERHASMNNEAFLVIAEALRHAEKQGEEPPEELDAMMQEVVGGQLSSLRLQLESTQQQTKLGREQLVSVKEEMSRYFRYAVALAAVMFAYYAVLGVSRSFLVRFTHELERFTLRVQGLAKREELAHLVMAESLVKDEKSAESYVAAMYVIAKRHGIESLCTPFLLWGTPNADTEEATEAG